MDRPQGHNRLVHLRADWQMTESYFSYHRSHVHSLFDELIHKSWGCAQWRPPVDILETEGAHIINVDLPGVEEESVNVEIHGRTLIIYGEREIRPDEKTVQIHLQERSKGDFARAFEFAEEIEKDSIERSHRNGVLTLIVAKNKNE